MRNAWAWLYEIEIACLGLLVFAVMLAFALSGCSAPSQESGPVTDNPSAAQAPAEDGKKPEGLWQSNENLGLDVVPASQLLDAAQVDAMIKENPATQVIDIRPSGRFARGHIDGSRNIPAGRQFELRSDEIKPDGQIVLVSSEDDKVGAAWQTLQDLGYRAEDVFVLSGGVQACEKAGLPLKETEHMGC